MPLKRSGLSVLILVAVGLPFLLYRTPPKQKSAPSNLLIKNHFAPNTGEREEESEEEELEFSKKSVLHEFVMLRNPVTGTIPAHFHKRELEAAGRIRDRRPARDPWLSGITGVTDITNQNTYKTIGPTNVAGRSRTLAFDRRNPAIIVTGGVTGGIFRSADGGATWAFVSPENGIRSATSIVQDPAHPDTWYCGTGEAFYTAPANMFGFTAGHGIYKSTDNGLTWSKLTSTEGDENVFDNPFDYVHRLAVQPATGYVYAAVHRRIMRSRDGGQSWEQVMGSATTTSAIQGLTEIAITSDGSKIFAAFSGGNPDRTLAGVWESASGNVGSWKRIAGGVKGQPDSVAGWRAYELISDETRQQGKWDRIVLALNSSNTKLFALYKNDQSSDSPTPKPEADLFGCDISSGTPASYVWKNLSAYVPDEPNYDQPNLDPYSTYFNGFAMSLAVKPDNDNILFIGGSMIHRVNLTQTDPAKKFRRIGGYGRGFFAGEPNEYPNHHPDVHGIYFAPGSADQLYTADDGGIQKTSTSVMADTVRWQPLVNGLQTIQYQTISISPDVQDFTVTGGTQDNSTLINNDPLNSTDHAQIVFGDGATSAISNFTKTGNTWKQNYFASVVNGRVFRLGLTYQYDPATNSLDFKSNTFDEITPSGATGDKSQWITLFVNDPDSSEHLYYNTSNKLYRTTKASSVKETTWTQVSAVGSTIPADEYFTSMAISKKVNGNKYLYFATDNGHVHRLKNPDTAAVSTKPVDITPAAMQQGVYVAGMAVNPRNPDTVLAVVSNYDAAGSEVRNIFWTGNATAAKPTWQVLDGALAPVSSQSCEIVVKTTGVEYYVGTSVGLYSTTAINGNSTQWVREGNGLMKTAIIRALKNRQKDNTMVIGTHGNGAFITQIGSAVNLDVVTSIPDPITNDKTFINAVYPTITNAAVQYRTGNLFTIKKISVQLYALNGQLVYQEQHDYQNGTVDLSRLARGTYILTIYSDDRKYRHIQKVLKQ